jgi:predicted nucleic acid-binding protein
VLVLDASAAIELLLRRPRAADVEARLIADVSVHVPHLLAVEVAHACRRLHLAGEVDDRRGQQVLADLADLDAHRYPHEPLLDRAWGLRHTLTIYDAMYVALAEVLDAPLVTLDARLAGAPGHRATVDLIG